ncbi:MAG: pyridoxamine 5'-phosphate oxidase [Verrucomicrobiota bacterium JB023]|nr:pyridoxamine 5'-phosphate oxidase [Verrucomicrobiota bacterium JB023]
MNREKTDIAALRQNYTRGGLEVGDLQASPIDQFQAWMEEAIGHGLVEPNAMTLATVDQEGQPSVRTVLLKGLDERGFRFFTNYRSQKGNDLEGNPKAALSFLWRELERQVNITGFVEKTSREETADYFRTRPYGSQIGAWVSERQSEAIDGREVLVDREKALLAQFPEESGVPVPEFWGGYLLVPTSVEFWQGRESRLHDRLRYQQTEEGRWQIERLSP